jgi:hypothetical protein
MLPKLLRARKRTAFCKYAILITVCFALVIWWSATQQPVPNINLAQPEAAPAGIGLEDLKEIQDKILKEAEFQERPKDQEVVIKQPIVAPKKRNNFNKYDLEIAADMAKMQPGLGDNGKGTNCIQSFICIFRV